MKRELQILLTAVMFYTRIPCPKWVGHNPEFISLSTRYFPLIGWLVGGVYALTILLLTAVFSPLVGLLLALAMGVLLTGAFHEDGFADVCDGFGGGWTKDKILLIMADSRLGTYGTVGLILILLLKITITLDLTECLNDLPFLLLIISSHSLSRMMAVTIIYSQPYARGNQDSKAKPVAMGISTFNLSLAVVFGLTPFLFFLLMTNFVLAVVLIPMLITTWYLTTYFKKWIGGYTGDCLGAAQQVNEVIFLLLIMAIWKYT